MAKGCQPTHESQRESVCFSETMVGHRFADFDVLGVAGRGGMGLVFKAREVRTGRLVALKVLQALTKEDREPIRRFLAEARALARLEHRNIPRIHAMGRQGHVYYLATDYIEGDTVAQIIDGGGHFTPRRALEIAVQVAEALRVAHRHDILHRDIKSDNIMVDNEKSVKVLDFGIARDLNARKRITRADVYLGSPEYCSPEQLRADTVDVRSDIYSLGIVLHEMLTGQLPYDGRSTVELYHKMRRNRRPALGRLMPGAPSSLKKLMKQLLAPHAVKRFQTIDDVITALEAVIPSLGAFGWDRMSVKRFARKRPSLIPERIASLFF